MEWRKLSPAAQDPIGVVTRSYHVYSHPSFQAGVVCFLPSVCAHSHLLFASVASAIISGCFLCGEQRHYTPAPDHDRIKGPIGLRVSFKAGGVCYCPPCAAHILDCGGC